MFRSLKSRLRAFRPFWLALRRLSAHGGFELAGFLAYTALVSLFPFVIFLFALAGFLGSGDTAQAVMDAAFRQLPPEVAQTLSPIVTEIFSNHQPELLTIGIIGTLWVTSSGIEALRLGCERSWEVQDTRPFWRRRLTSLVFVALGSLSALATSTIVVIAPLVLHEIHHLTGAGTVFIVLSTVLRLLFAMGLMATTLAMLYRYLPSTTIAWRKVWPGAWLAALLWILLASIFSFYLSRAGNYTVTYGSLGGVVITLLFMQFSAIIFLYGVEFSAVLAHRRNAASQTLASRHAHD